MHKTTLLLVASLLAACTVAPLAATPGGPAAATRAPAVATSTNIPAAASPSPAAPVATGVVPLVILAPEDGDVVNLPQVEVRGTTVADAVLTLNDEIGVADENGAFAVMVPLVEGPNAIEIVVSDLDGNETRLELAVTYDPSA